MNKKRISFAATVVLMLLFVVNAMPSAHAMGPDALGCLTFGLGEISQLDNESYAATEAQSNYYPATIVSMMVTYPDALRGGQDFTFDAVKDPNSTIYLPVQNPDPGNNTWGISVTITLRTGADGSEYLLGLGQSPGFTWFDVDDGEFPEGNCLPEFVGQGPWVHADQTITFSYPPDCSACNYPAPSGIGSTYDIYTGSPNGTNGASFRMESAPSPTTSSSSTTTTAAALQSLLASIAYVQRIFAMLIQIMITALTQG